MLFSYTYASFAVRTRATRVTARIEIVNIDFLRRRPRSHTRRPRCSDTATRRRLRNEKTAVKCKRPKNRFPTSGTAPQARVAIPEKTPFAFVRTRLGTRTTSRVRLDAYGCTATYGRYSFWTRFPVRRPVHVVPRVDREDSMKIRIRIRYAKSRDIFSSRKRRVILFFTRSHTCTWPNCSSGKNVF